MNKKPDGRDGLWKQIRCMKTFKLADLQKNSKMTKSAILHYLKTLIKGGYVLCANDTAVSEAKVYRLVKDNGVLKPELKKNGELKPPSHSQRMWAAMKVLKKFSVKDLSLTSSVTDGSAKNYIFWLLKAGYIRAINNGNGLYMFLGKEDTGPRAPLIRRDKTVYDQNLCKTVYRHVTGGAK